MIIFLYGFLTLTCLTTYYEINKSINWFSDGQNDNETLDY